jgi:hypothetical protein
MRTSDGITKEKKTEPLSTTMIYEKKSCSHPDSSSPPPRIVIFKLINYSNVS